MIFETDDIIKNINPADGVDISTVVSEIMPNQYFIFKTGGPHFFSKCKNKSVVRDIYLQNIWPFIYNIKGNQVDYRVDNLRWTTLKGNSKGSGGEKSDPDTVYKLISEQLWFHELGANTATTPKDKHHEFIADPSKLKYLSFKEEFEKKLLNEKKH